ncbi:phosphodiesterase [Blastococcus sp. VKM Ac-2987]|uniref:phosphodiesterase n=1 Tax=Blastococcus sp. VKM Ac-2987 TaxID=3004141 RepID=UPI0022AB91E4|nr:phosphodiesterase [Blastococcus sp. VKM Ac-2987]MCZ2859168.1 phosphodiesterase [Blastococcus sp. VKM Ac-2987]
MRDLAGVAGGLVAVPFGAVARWRRGRPLHPRGAVLDAVLDRRGGSPSFGVPWLDEVRSDRVVVRMSRGAGLPAPLPDVLGLAVRLPGAAGSPVDLLLSTSGRGPLTRRVPVPRRDAAAVYGSIMAYRTAAGPVRLAAFPERTGIPSDPAPLAVAAERGAVAFTVAAAVGSGGWRPFALLRVEGAHRPPAPAVRFDAVRHAPPGLAADGPLARFREPAYAIARQVGRPSRQ